MCNLLLLSGNNPNSLNLSVFMVSGEQLAKNGELTELVGIVHLVEVFLIPANHDLIANFKDWYRASAHGLQFFSASLHF